MNYTIKVNYITGDSFTSKETFDSLSPIWKEKKDVYIALLELHAYNEYYMAYENERWTPSKQNKVLELARKQPWAVSDHEGKLWDFYDGMMIHHEGGRVRICTWFITGHFERLISADVEVDLESVGDWQSHIDLEGLEMKYGSH
ncbi:hypothetical protein HPMBJEAJ_00372 [Aeromonas phage avDM6]|nr:hypothetical protein HPMBJEAJ_00372 [Aeromonas phage avDM6]